MSSSRWAAVARDCLFALGGSAVALLLLRYLHDEWQLGWAVACGVVAGVVLRRAVAPAYASFPDFLRRPLDVSVVLLGALVAAWATLAAPGYGGLFYVTSRWRQAVALPAVAAVLGLGIAAAVYTHARMRREVEEHRVRESVLREAALRAQLRALQAQINPHFLFNAFNALAELTHDDPDRAEELIADLAHLLRYSLRSSAVASVTLRQELEAVERYLSVERARLGERLRVERCIDPAALDAEIPGLILQPLVENAVQHAVAPRPEGGLVRIVAHGDGEAIEIAVEDDGPGLPASVAGPLHRLERAGEMAAADGTVTSGTAGAGGGLINVQQRLLLSYRGRAQMSVRHPEAGGCRIELRLPR